MSEDGDKQQRTQLESVLGLDQTHSRWRRLGGWLGAIVLLGSLAAAYFYYRSSNDSAGPRFLTEEVTRGDLTVTVSATGNLQPTNKVDVGSELSGTIEAVMVDDNDRVKKGQVLARLDTSKLRDQVARSRASLAAAEAKVLQVQATVDQSRSSLERLREVARLSGGKVPSRSEMDIAEATLARALADAAAARASVGEIRAALSSDETNLTKGSIRSPIDGVVLKRQVEPGQTVAASFQAPVLFTLAETLSQMELQVDVDEADVGEVRAAQSASFTVDAYAGRQYPARVSRVGLGSQIKEGVVSYLTILAVNNDDLSLRPGMTATAEIITATRENVLLLPNAALRFTPPVQPQAKDRKDVSIVGSLIPQPPSQPRRRTSATTASKEREQQVWVLRNGALAAIRVSTGVSNGRLTEITGGELEPGMRVVTEALGPQP